MQSRQVRRREEFRAVFAAESGHRIQRVRTFFGPKKPDGSQSFRETNVLVADDRRPRRERRAVARRAVSGRAL